RPPLLLCAPTPAAAPGGAGFPARPAVRLEQQVVVDPLDHYSTDLESVAVPIYDSHPITDRIALTFYPGVRPLTLLPVPPGVTVTPLFWSSKESYTRAVQPVETRQPQLSGERSTTTSISSLPPGRRTLAVAVEGTWPEGGAE